MKQHEIIESFLFDFLRANGFPATILYSEITSQWYISCAIEVKNGDLLTSICEHRDSPEKARSAFIRRLSGSTVVIYNFDGNRTEICIPAFC